MTTNKESTARWVGLTETFKLLLHRSGRLLSRHRDTIAGPCIYPDDLLLLRFVLRAEDKSWRAGCLLWGKEKSAGVTISALL